MLSLCYPCDEIRHGSEEKWKKEADLYLNSLFCNENQVIKRAGSKPRHESCRPNRYAGAASRLNVLDKSVLSASL